MNEESDNLAIAEAWEITGLKMGNGWKTVKEKDNSACCENWQKDVGRWV